MKLSNIKLYFLCLFLITNIVSGQNIDVEPELENLSNIDFLLNDPTVCNSSIGHGDGPVTALRIKGNNNSFGDSWARTLRFRANFLENAEYDLGNDNQLDWNKLMTINRNVYTDRHSIRLGWRWSVGKQKMEVGLYGHINHTSNQLGREFLHVTDVDLEAFNDYELILGSNGTGIIADGKGSFIKREDIFPENLIRTAFRRRAYFGGQECPPHDIDIQVRDIRGDDFTNWHDAACSKTFSRSVFYDYDDLIIEVADRIIMSQQVFKGQWNQEHEDNGEIPVGFEVGDEMEWSIEDNDRFVDINSGSRLHCKAGDEILFLDGFFGKSGSRFHAEIDTSIVCGDFVRMSNGSGNQTAEDIFKIYPNPANGIVKIEIIASDSDYHFKIYDTMGMEIRSNAIMKDGAFNVDLSNIPNGIYIVKVSNAEGSWSKKLIKI